MVTSIVTDHIYKNSQGKYLINFNKHGDHKDVEKMAKNRSLKTIEIDETSYAPTLPKEPECIATSEGIESDLALATSLAEAVKALGVSDNDTGV